jgi:hypothetical protein
MTHEPDLVHSNRIGEDQLASATMLTPTVRTVAVLGRVAKQTVSGADSPRAYCGQPGVAALAHTVSSLQKSNGVTFDP